jgi:SAM-dependent methyltransferase
LPRGRGAISDGMGPVRRGALTRTVLIGIVALGLWLLCLEFAVIGGGRSGAETRTHAQAVVVPPAAWRSRQWRRAVDYHAAVLGRLLKDGLLAASSRAVCLGGDIQASIALRELGVVGAVAVSRKGSPPLAVASGDDRTLPFPYSTVDLVFADRALDASKSPADLAGEAARIVKPDGYLAVLKSGIGDAYNLWSLQALLPSLRLLKSREIDGLDGRSMLRELVFRKHTTTSSAGNSARNCTDRDNKRRIVGLAEPLIQDEPAKPWITLKRNVRTSSASPRSPTSASSTDTRTSTSARGATAPASAAGSGSSTRSGTARSRSSPWRRTRCSTPNTQPTGVTLLSYAAWVRNGTLVFEINDRPASGNKADGRKARGHGMGRIRPAAGGTAEGLSREKKKQE